MKTPCKLVMLLLLTAMTISISSGCSDAAGVVSALRTYSGADYIQTDTPVNQDYEDINLVIPVNQVSDFIALYVKQ